jgi:hypothetical protein
VIDVLMESRSNWMNQSGNIRTYHNVGFYEKKGMRELAGNILYFINNSLYHVALF